MFTPSVIIPLCILFAILWFLNKKSKSFRNATSIFFTIISGIFGLAVIAGVAALVYYKTSAPHWAIFVVAGFFTIRHIKDTIYSGYLEIRGPVRPYNPYDFGTDDWHSYDQARKTKEALEDIRDKLK